MLDCWLIAWWVLFLALAWWPCCCEEPAYYEDCWNCVDGEAPYYITVVVDGVVDGTCSECSAANATYLLEVVPECYWLDSGNTICAANANRQLVPQYDGTWKLRFVIEPCSHWFTATNAEDNVDCMNAGGTGPHLLEWYESEPWSNPGDCDPCDFSSATAEVYSGDTT